MARCFALLRGEQKPHLRKAQLGIRARAMRVYPRALSATQTPFCVCTCDWPHRQPSWTGGPESAGTKHKILPLPDSAAHHWLDGRVTWMERPAHSFIPAPRRQKCVQAPFSLRSWVWALSSALTCGIAQGLELLLIDVVCAARPSH
ncbi:hypothetical protein GGI42DRAFT_230894 [Trichoderma sp. SZMC 28013]